MSRSTELTFRALEALAAQAEPDWDSEWLETKSGRSFLFVDEPGGDAPRKILVRVARNDEGRLVCTGLVLGAFGESEITTRGLRRLRLADTLTQVGEWARLHPGNARDLFGPSGPGRHIRPVTRPGPKGYPDSHYRRLADNYRKAADTSRAPVKSLARQEIKSEPTIRRWLQTARAKGYLGASIPGRAGEQIGKQRRRKR